jgi:hydrogenase nickel incorporation protein HypB
MADIPVLKAVTEANAVVAEALRAAFAREDVLVLNIIASPGAGKTTLLERTVETLGHELRMLVVEGDPSTSLDAERIIAAGAPAVQINTQGGCHLDANMVQMALERLDIQNADVVIIENVGNLLCPTGWDLGEDAKVVVASLPEGDDKPLKYPMAFATAQAVVINKTDLEPYIPANASALRDNALKINPDLTVMALSCLTGEGFDQWLDWVREELNNKRGAPS